LGVHFDTEFSFKDHITAEVNKTFML